MSRLSKEFKELTEQSAELESTIIKNLKDLGYDL